MAAEAATNGPWDVVFTWVDGARPGFQTDLARALAASASPPHPRAIGANRFRPTPCLRYALRSIAKHGRGLGRIFVVTNGERPAWLEADGERLVFVDHAKIIDADHRPTFNSNAIEWCLHRIPGLSDPFVYFNDDVLLTADFSFANGMATSPPTLSLEGWPMYRDPTAIDPVGGSAAFNASLLDERFGPRAARPEAPHEPLMLHKAVLAELERAWPAEIAATRAHKLRTPRDVVLPRMYVHYLLEQLEAAARRGDGPPPRLAPTSAVLLSYGGPSADFSSQLQRLPEHLGAFLCINDELGERGDGEGADNERLLEAFLAWFYPTPAPWERDRRP
ncbi:MAG TPA: stealth conserved region 3 domain-containing protein [Caulobacteraceae bacterium]|jgi:hypothetical protein